MSRIFISRLSWRSATDVVICVYNLVPLIPALLRKAAGARIVTVMVTIPGTASCPQARPGPKPTGGQRRGASGVTGPASGIIGICSSYLPVLVDGWARSSDSTVQPAGSISASAVVVGLGLDGTAMNGENPACGGYNHTCNVLSVAGDRCLLH